MTEEKYIRPTWDEYFLELIQVVGRRGTCDRGRSGCVVVRDKQILSTGYVGAPIGVDHCDDIGHQMHTVINEEGKESQHCVRTAHAEANAIAQAARNGIALKDSILYCKMVPCYTCAKMIINAGIVRVVALKDYHASSWTKEIFRKAEVHLDIVNSEVEQYNNQ